MSRTTELAEAEAQRAEAEPEDERNGEAAAEDEEGGSTEYEPAPAVDAPAMTAKEIEQREKAMDKEAQRHRDAVAKIMGEDIVVLSVCPLCIENAPGFVAPPGMYEYSTEEKTAALVVLGEDVPTPLREAEGVEMCDRCDGYGQLRYPTRSPHVTTQQCPKCTGNGYVLTQPQPVQNGGGFQPVLPPTPQLTGFGGYEAPDQWQRPLGHPHYGIPPADVRP